MLREFLKESSPLLGTLLIAVGAFFAYRSSERKLATPPPAKAPAFDGDVLKALGASLGDPDRQRWPDRIAIALETIAQQGTAMNDPERRKLMQKLNECIERIERHVEEIAAEMRATRHEGLTRK